MVLGIWISPCKTDALDPSLQKLYEGLHLSCKTKNYKRKMWQVTHGLGFVNDFLDITSKT